MTSGVELKVPTLLLRPRSAASRSRMFEMIELNADDRSFRDQQGFEV